MRMSRIRSVIIREQRYEAPQAQTLCDEVDPYRELARATLPNPRDWSMR